MSFMSANKAGTIGNISDTFNNAFLLYISGQYCEAYALYLKISREDRSIPVLFNTALCRIQAGEYEDAAVLLEECRSAALSLPKMREEVPDKTFKSLSEKDKGSDSYKSPMIRDVSQMNSVYVNDKIIRILIDCYFEQKNNTKVMELSGLVKHKNFDNINNILSKI